jgi:predicted nucleic-acid-binding Zn-ribbon protein
LALKKTQEKQAQKWVRKKSTHTNCPKCESNDWTYGDLVKSATYEKGGGLVFGGNNGLPLLLVTCGNCGYVEQWSAEAVGIK